MKKPQWQVRSSSYVIESPYLRLRKDEVELPNGTVVADYYVRESRGFVIVFALTEDQRVVLVEQYRYGNDSLVLELPAGSIDEDEEPRVCAERELAEETGYRSDNWESVMQVATEPVRSDSVMHLFIARDAVLSSAQQLDPTEHIEVRLVTIPQLRAMLREGAIQSVAAIAAAYAALERITT